MSPPTPRPARSRTRSARPVRRLPGLLALAVAALALLAGAAGAQTEDLDALTAKKLAKNQARLTKLEALLPKLQAKVDARQEKVDLVEALLVEAQGEEVAAAFAMGLAEAALAAAEALPQTTPEEVAERKQAIKAAKKILAVAKKALKKAGKRVAKRTKGLAKAENKLAKATGKLQAVQLERAEVLAFIDALTNPFDFASVAAVGLDVRVLDGEGLPVSGAFVQLADSIRLPRKKKTGEILPFLLEDHVSERTYGQGLTDDEGVLSLTVRVPTALAEVDVIVDKTGLDGPYTEETLRAEWGPVAPSARVTTSTKLLDGLVVTLDGADS